MVKRKYIGVTGAPASGKSYLCDLIVKICNDHFIEAHNIDYDKLAHQIYEGDDYVSACVKKELRKHFPGVVQEHRLPVRQYIPATIPLKGQLSHESVDRKLLGDIVFARPEKLETLNKIMAEPIKKQFIKSIRNKHGLILINSALIAEHEMYDIDGGLSVGHIKCKEYIVTMANDDIQLERLRIRGLSDEKIKQLLATQLTSEEKFKIIDDAGYEVWFHKTSKPESAYKEVVFIKALIRTFFKVGELL